MKLITLIDSLFKGYKASVLRLIFVKIGVCFTLVCSTGLVYAYMSSKSINELLLKGDSNGAMIEADRLKKDLLPVDYANTTASALLMTGKFKQAEAALEPFYLKDPNNPLLANNYAVALWGLGKKDQARKVLEKALMTSSPAFRSLRKIYMAQAAESYSKALDDKSPLPATILLAAANTGQDLIDKPVVVAQVAKPVTPVAQTLPPAKILPADKPVPQVAQVTPAPTVEKDPPLSAQDAAQIRLNMQEWSKAWSSKNVKSYLAFYSPSFKPENSLSYSQWLEQRKVRVGKPGPISVEVKVMNLTLNKNKVVVSFRQKYRSNNVNANSVKYLEWVNDKGNWLITREYNK